MSGVACTTSTLHEAARFVALCINPIPLPSVLFNLQGHQKQAHDLENEVAALRAELERKDEQLAAAAARNREAQEQISELQQELENNAGALRTFSCCTTDSQARDAQNMA